VSEQRDIRSEWRIANRDSAEGRAMIAASESFGVAVIGNGAWKAIPLLVGNPLAEDDE
jgi:hypothetical protein